MNIVYQSDNWNLVNGTWETDFNEQDEREFRALCEAMGFMVINWALLEQQLDIWTSIIFKNFDGNKIQQEIPKGLVRRSDFLKTAFRNIHKLSELTEEAINIVIGVNDIATSRDHLIHGVIENMKPKEGKWTITKLDHHSDRHVKKDIFLGAKNMAKLIDDIVPLGSRALRLSDRLLSLR